LIGATYAATLICYVQANKLTTAAGTIFLQSTAPLYLLLLGPWLLREPVHRRDIVFSAAIALGMAMFFVGTDAPLATAPDPFLGNILGALAGVLWAFTLTGFRWAAREHREAGSAAAVAFAGNLIVALACLPSLLPLPDLGAADLAAVSYLGIFQIGLAYVFLVHGIRHVHALAASLLLLIEPVLNPIWAWLFQSEIPGTWTLAGGGIILATTAIKSWIDTRRKSTG
jgi:drug/metabolite transporter (DMT)-like permease